MNENNTGSISMQFGNNGNSFIGSGTDNQDTFDLFQNADKFFKDNETKTKARTNTSKLTKSAVSSDRKTGWFQDEHVDLANQYLQGDLRSKHKSDDRFDAASALLIDQNNLKGISSSEIPGSSSGRRHSSAQDRSKFRTAINLTMHSSTWTKKEWKQKLVKEKKFKEAHRAKAIKYLDALKK